MRRVVIGSLISLLVLTAGASAQDASETSLLGIRFHAIEILAIFLISFIVVFVSRRTTSRKLSAVSVQMYPYHIIVPGKAHLPTEEVVEGEHLGCLAQLPYELQDGMKLRLAGQISGTVHHIESYLPMNGNPGFQLVTVYLSGKTANVGIQYHALREVDGWSELRLVG